jgi:DNA-directed RNA polymerase specialized sigma24 family protein
MMTTNALVKRWRERVVKTVSSRDPVQHVCRTDRFRLQFAAMTEVRRDLIRKLENADAFPLIALQALRELEQDLESLQNQAILRARELGASLEDIADAMGITRQGVAYRLKTLDGHDRPQGDEVIDISEADSETRP